MKAINVNVLKNLDHPDVKDLGGRTEKQRRQYRTSIIKSFLKWANNDPTRFVDFNPNSDEKILLKTEERAYHLAHFLAKDSLTLGFVQRLAVTLRFLHAQKACHIGWRPRGYCRFRAAAQ